MPVPSVRVLSASVMLVVGVAVEVVSGIIAAASTVCVAALYAYKASRSASVPADPVAPVAPVAP